MRGPTGRRNAPVDNHKDEPVTRRAATEQTRDADSRAVIGAERRLQNGISEREEIVRVPVDPGTRRMSAVFIAILALILALIVLVVYVSTAFLDPGVDGIRIRTLVDAMIRLAAITAVIMIVLWAGQRFLSILAVIIMAAVIMPENLYVQGIYQLSALWRGGETDFTDKPSEELAAAVSDTEGLSEDQKVKQVIETIRELDNSRALRVEDLLLFKYARSQDFITTLQFDQFVDPFLNGPLEAEILKVSVLNLTDAAVNILDCTGVPFPDHIETFEQANAVATGYKTRCRLTNFGRKVGAAAYKDARNDGRIASVLANSARARDALPATGESELDELPGAPADVSSLSQRNIERVSLPFAASGDVSEQVGELFFVFESVETTFVKFDFLSDDTDAYLEFYTVRDDQLVLLTDDDDGGNGTNSRIVHQLDAGMSYVLWVAPLSGYREKFRYAVTACPLAGSLRDMTSFQEVAMVIDEAGDAASTVCARPSQSDG